MRGWEPYDLFRVPFHKMTKKKGDNAKAMADYQPVEQQLIQLTTSIGMVIPKPIMSFLGFKIGDKVFIVWDDWERIAIGKDRDRDGTGKRKRSRIKAI